MLECDVNHNKSLEESEAEETLLRLYLDIDTKRVVAASIRSRNRSPFLPIAVDADDRQAGYCILAQEIELSVDVLNRSVADLRPAGTEIGLQLDMSTLRQAA